MFLDVAPPTLVDLTVPAEVGNRLAGDYEVGAFRFGVDVLGFVYADAHLAMRLGGVDSGGPTLPLRYQGNNRFVSAVDDEHGFVFEAQPAGAETVLMHYYEGVIDATKPAAKQP